MNSKIIEVCIRFREGEYMSNSPRTVRSRIDGSQAGDLCNGRIEDTNDRPNRSSTNIRT